MSLKDYLEKFAHANTLTLIGPMIEGLGVWKEPLIFVDGGAVARRGPEGFAIGDGDSTGIKLDFVLPAKKNDSDLKVVLETIPQNFSELQMLGFSGGRKDHELINWGEIHHFLKQRTLSTRVKINAKILALSRGYWELDMQGIFSLVVFENTKINMTGACDYPLSPAQILQAVSSHGLSNRGHGLIKIESDGPFFIFMESKFSF